MSVSCIFPSDETLLALGSPAKTLVARNRAELAESTKAIQTGLESEYRFVAGLLPYEAGLWLRSDKQRTFPYPIVIHFYKTLPRPLNTRAEPMPPFALAAPFSPDQDKPSYLQNLQRIKAYLEAGDCYQVNLAQRFSTRFSGPPLTAWLELQKAHPAPHRCYFDTGTQVVFGVSPERFLSIRGHQVVTEPIKGSRPRGQNLDADDAFSADLQSNPKDRAENLMIVDLLRNDLGTVCKPGTVKADPLFELRRFSNVQHLVSTVTGQLRDDVSPVEALLSAFPGGSITGAPKKRAMEIIDELEPVPRGAYCGSFFWMDNQGNLDSNILIRTLQTEGDKLYCHGGGGIVFDSDPEAEYEESRFKVEKLMGTLEQRFL